MGSYGFGRSGGCADLRAVRRACRRQRGGRICRGGRGHFFRSAGWFGGCGVGGCEGDRPWPAGCDAGRVVGPSRVGMGDPAAPLVDPHRRAASWRRTARPSRRCDERIGGVAARWRRAGRVPAAGRGVGFGLSPPAPALTPHRVGDRVAGPAGPIDHVRRKSAALARYRDGTLSPTRGRIRTSGNDRGPTGPPILQTSRATAIRGNQGAKLRAPTRPTAASGRVGVATQPPAGRPGCFRPADRARDRATLAMADRDGTLSPTRGRIRTSGNDRGPTGPPILQTSRATAIRGNQGAGLPAGQRRHAATRSKGGAPAPPRDRSPGGPTSGC